MITTLLKDVEEENKLALETEDFIKSMGHNVSKSCFSCQHLRRYITRLGGYTTTEFGCKLIYDYTKGKVITKPNYLSCCKKIKKMAKYKNKRDLRFGTGFPVFREPELIMYPDEGDAEVITFKGGVEAAAWSVPNISFIGDDIPIEQN